MERERDIWKERERYGKRERDMERRREIWKEGESMRERKLK